MGGHEIFLAAQQQVSEGNLILSKGTYDQINQTSGQLETKSYANLDLSINQTNSSSYTYADPQGNIIGNYTLNLEALTLPLSRGYGNVKALPMNKKIIQPGIENIFSSNNFRLVDREIFMN